MFLYIPYVPTLNTCDVINVLLLLVEICNTKNLFFFLDVFFIYA